ncbi:mannose-6-phosphate isomerase, class I [Gordonia sp. NPDC003424]
MTVLYQMSNPIRSYAWGDVSTLAQLQGREPSGEPEAELWVGAHVSGPSTIRRDGRDVPVTEVLPQTVGSAGDGTFPFLMKILAIAKPLSLQVHPTAEQAAEGFDREDAAGIAIDAPDRTFRDRFGKPEVVVAVTPMLMLNGERDRAQLARVQREFGFAWLQQALEESSGSVIKTVLSWPARRWQHALAETRRVLQGAEVSESSDQLRRDVVDAYATLFESFPDDRGVLVALCMHLLRLEPGQAVATTPGQLHAYLSGTAIEIMDNSDNVLRAGLTPKHVDVDALITVTRDQQDLPTLMRPVQVADGITVYRLWRDDIALCRVDVDDQVEFCSPGGLSVVLALSGELCVATAEQSLPLRQGHSLLCVGEPAALTITGHGVAYIGVDIGVDRLRSCSEARW